MAYSTYNKVQKLYYYDDFEDNLLTGRTSPRRTWTNGVSANPGVTAISSTSPLEGTYSLTHVGGGNLSHYDRAYISHPVGSAGFIVEFKLRCVTQGVVANTPAGMIFVEYVDGNNFTAMEWYFDGTNTVLRIKQRVASVNTYYGTMNWFAGKMGTGTTYNIGIRRTASTMRITINGENKIAVNVPTLAASIPYFAVSGQYDTKIMIDKLLFRWDQTNTTYDSVLATYGALSAERDYSTNLAIDGTPAATDTTITFDDINYIFRLVTVGLDGSINKTRWFNPTTTQVYNLGYEGLDKYMALRVRVYVQCTTDAKFNIKQIAFTSE